MRQKTLARIALVGVALATLSCGQQERPRAELQSQAERRSQPLLTPEVLAEATINVAIPEVGDSEYRFMVDGTGFINGMSVQIRITHTFIGDLRVVLFAPSGKQAVLHDRLGSSDDNIIKTYGLGGEPSPAVDSLNGEDINGEWRLFVNDGAAGDFGTINYIKLSANRVFR